ncbi:MAG TPA: DUF3576 domain-containing protein [Rhodobacteraceae bacterium]|nr:DUF3576 domain-containing protein [Amylibacter sp.]MDG1235456.1 DUF3576 domain-containing protein [Amylibacter sp.]MDG1997922.1 DUF3576 domain-containing protein [Amylibacter sp.]HAD28791.1 DUF3576 domain-containing protein [Paracoccaceae bacterium]
MNTTFTKVALIATILVVLSGCGGFGTSSLGSGFFGGKRPSGPAQEQAKNEDPHASAMERALGESRDTSESIFDALLSPDQNTNVRVNKYLWNASLETLSFLPLDSADPFTGVIALGWGRAPGSSRQYRATVLVQDPALDARSLKVSIQTRGGVASAETVRRIEDAILTRARQLRVRDKNL